MSPGASGEDSSSSLYARLVANLIISNDTEATTEAEANDEAAINKQRVSFS